MEVLYSGMALFLLLTPVAGLWRVLHGPTAADRMPVAQLFGTTAVACLLLLLMVLILLGGRLLEYPPSFAGALILLIEAAATLSIGITLAALFLGGRPEAGPHR